MQYVSCILRTDFSFRLPSDSTHGIKWVLSLDMLPIVSGSVMHYNVGNLSSPLWMHRLHYLTVTVVFLPNFKRIQIGYTTPAELRRLGRATSSPKVFDRQLKQRIRGNWMKNEPMATDAPAQPNRAEASSSSQQPPPRPQPEVEPVRDVWEEVAQQHTFVFHKPDNTMCRSVLLAEERNINGYPHSIDETPKFVDNPTSGTAPIEHYIRRLVTYLARLQSVTQNSEKGLNLKAYVKLDTKQWKG